MKLIKRLIMVYIIKTIIKNNNFSWLYEANEENYDIVKSEDDAYDIAIKHINDYLERYELEDNAEYIRECIINTKEYEFYKTDCECCDYLCYKINVKIFEAKIMNDEESLSEEYYNEDGETEVYECERCGIEYYLRID